MVSLLTIDDLEQEIKYLRVQNQEILRKLYRTEGENIKFLRQIKDERKKLATVLDSVSLEHHHPACAAYGKCTCRFETIP